MSIQQSLQDTHTCGFLTASFTHGKRRRCWGTRTRIESTLWICQNPRASVMTVSEPGCAYFLGASAAGCLRASYHSTVKN